MLYSVCYSRISDSEHREEAIDFAMFFRPKLYLRDNFFKNGQKNCAV